jgi:hypothetical protein
LPGEQHGHAGDADIAVAPQHGEILGRTTQPHRQRSRVAAGFRSEARNCSNDPFWLGGWGERGTKNMPPMELAERLALLIALALFLGLAFEEIYKRDEPTIPGGIRTFPVELRVTV